VVGLRVCRWLCVGGEQKKKNGRLCVWVGAWAGGGVSGGGGGDENM